MALVGNSLFLFDLDITSSNRSLDFRAVSLGPIRMATLNLGSYSATDLLAEIKRAMEAADPTNTYTVTINRTLSGGTSNRITISTSGAYLDLLFGTGPRVVTSVASTIGFAATDRTGATTYTGTTQAGTVLLPEMTGYSYLGPDFLQTNFGALSVTAGGQKEAVIWSIQRFIQVEFKYEPEMKVITEWAPFMGWAIQQKPFEFTPNVSFPTVVYKVTLESTSADGKGLGYKMAEMLPDFPFSYQTGMLKMRVNN